MVKPADQPKKKKKECVLGEKECILGLLISTQHFCKESKGSKMCIWGEKADYSLLSLERILQQFFFST